MLKLSWYFLFSISLMTSFACAVPDEEFEGASEEIAVLEADSQKLSSESLDMESQEPQQEFAGSCVGYCGGQASGGCWCDDSCAMYRDCCTDFQPVCNQLTNIRVSLYTGDDDKRSDTSVRLRLYITGNVTRDFMLSPTGERLGDRSLHVKEFSLSPTLGRDQITGCALLVDLGEGDGWTWHRDNWWMNGLVIDGRTSSGSYRTLLNHANWAYKFVADRTLIPLPCP